MSGTIGVVLVAVTTALCSWTNPQGPQYTVESSARIGTSLDSRFNEHQIEILEKLNRCDREHLSSLVRLVVPLNWTLNELDYSPLPARYNLYSARDKLIVVHLPGQMFGAYERGQLVYWGPVSSGGAHSPTPPGRYHLNWRSAGRCSTINPEWYMPWYFNFDNSLGLAFHEYALPGKPDSHGCIRLLRRDAKWLYEWGEAAGHCDPGTAPGQGTSVLISGSYNYHAQAPWQSDDWWKTKIVLPALPDATGTPQ